MELLAQAEHDPEAAVCAVSWDEDLLTAVRSEVARLLESAPRKEIAAEALASRGALLLAGDRTQALAFAEAYAAEHLAIFTDDPRGDMEGQTRSGTIFLGEESSVAFGDYMTGANHVLPTSGRASSFSGLSTLEFLRFFTWQELTPAGSAGMAEAVRVLAEAERLPAHAAAAAERADARSAAASGRERAP
jgi:histidinol dehydrogenase